MVPSASVVHRTLRSTAACTQRFGPACNPRDGTRSDGARRQRSARAQKASGALRPAAAAHAHDTTDPDDVCWHGEVAPAAGDEGGLAGEVHLGELDGL